MPEDFYTPYIDVIVAGEGVFSFREVILGLEKKIDLSGIPGAVRMENGPIVIHQRNQDADLDSLPYPRRDFTAHYRKSYFSK
jgi:radical SAM superfamily enzyme YgiQ (UPF0313 family)